MAPTLLVPGSLRLGDGSQPPGDGTPVEFITRWLKRRMPEFGGHDATLANRVLIIQAETGSGKSTTLPVAVFRILRDEKTPAGQRYNGPSVICTQPRVLTAIALATDVTSRTWNLDLSLGVNVGFQTGPVANRPPAGLVYATAGVLATQLQHQTDAEIMDMYRFILVDEAHERSLDCDLTLMQLRNFYHRNEGNERLPFLLMLSATFDTGRYADYFGLGAANIMTVQGRTYGVTTHWPAAGTNNYPAEAAAVALRIHAEHPDDPPERADILIFMPGGSESTVVVEALQEAAARASRDADAASPGPYLVLTVNREVVVSQTGDFPLIFLKPDLLPPIHGRRPVRRIIVSTIVAETGLTIDTLKYVIDAGWVRTTEVYPPWGARGLLTRPAPQSRIKQRMGRAGRLFEGEFYPLYTENVHAALDAQQLPDIMTSGPGDRYLALVSEQQRQKLRTGRVPEFRVEDITLLDPPPPEAFLAANATAVALGFISPRAPLPDRWPPASLLGALPAEPEAGPLAVARGYGLTPLGHLAAMFAWTPLGGVRAILAAYMWGASATDLITIVALFGTPVTDLLAVRGEQRGLPLEAAALRVALPGFLLRPATIGGATGMTPVLPPSESEAFFFRARLLIADDFIEALFVFDAFAEALERGVVAAAAWCADLKLNFKKLLEVAGRRDKIFEEMVVAGLNPYRAADRRLARLAADEFTDGVCRVKRCLYDGLRGTLLRYDDAHPAGPGYVTRQGLRVRVPPLFSDPMAARLRALHVATAPAAAWRPRWLLTDQIVLKAAPRKAEDAGDPLLYVATAGLVSVLDGYVAVDPDFGEPREFPV